MEQWHAEYDSTTHGAIIAGRGVLEWIWDSELAWAVLVFCIWGDYPEEGESALALAVEGPRLVLEGVTWVFARLIVGTVRGDVWVFPVAAGVLWWILGMGGEWGG